MRLAIRGRRCKRLRAGVVRSDFAATMSVHEGDSADPHKQVVDDGDAVSGQ
jgi:hypothetical protein